MCRWVGLALAVAAVAAGIQPARAQAIRGRDAPTRALLARAESLEADLGRRDSLARQEHHRQRLATRFDAGAVTVILPASMGDATGRRFASGAHHLLDSSGVIPQRFLASRIVVAYAAVGVDSVVRAERLDRRVRVMADISAAPDTLADGLLAADVLGQSYLGTLDPEWRKWLPTDLAMGWTMRIEGVEAVRDLMAGETRTGALCLAGEEPQCRLWLGLDRERDAHAERYQPAEVRRALLGRYWWRGMGGGLAGQCADGSDEACERLARLGDWIPAVPAGFASRGSLVRAVRTLHGEEALRQALADTAGSLGERLARAAHLSEDSLVGEWRSWLLTGGGQPRVTARVREAVPALVVVSLLLLAAAGSGRWR
jgi:hypothetical protein